MPAFTRRQIAAFHVIFVAPLLLYIGLYGLDASPLFQPFLMGLALVVAIYHGQNLFNA